jgi:hypothetical protein
MTGHSIQRMSQGALDPTGHSVTGGTLSQGTQSLGTRSPGHPVAGHSDSPPFHICIWTVFCVRWPNCEHSCRTGHVQCHGWSYQGRKFWIAENVYLNSAFWATDVSPTICWHFSFVKTFSILATSLAAFLQPLSVWLGGISLDVTQTDK